MTTTTIVAPATPYGIGGIAVVRLSGPQSKEILYKLINNNSLDNRVASLFNIFNSDGQHIDEVVVTLFRAPNSYTGEDVIEISCHGNPLIVEKIVSTCTAYGAKIAEAGEFTRRALINGKIDLLQAEAIASLIHAKSEESSVLNLRLLSGELSKKLKNIQGLLIKAASFTEFELDISEEGLQPDIVEKIKSISIEINKKLSTLLSSYKQARLLNKGAAVVIAGEPNVGKSTLLNSLSETDRAITSATPGTTRDAIDVPLLLDGVPINLIDTAGIRTTEKEIESEGVKRSHGYIKKADLVLLIQDASKIKNSNLLLPENTLIVQNKIDLLSKSETKNMVINTDNQLFISAKTGEGLELLKKRIKDELGISPSISNVLSVTTARQHDALIKCQKSVSAVFQLLSENPPSFELISIELREALDSVGAILGKTTPDDILNNIFGQFCVGK